MKEIKTYTERCPYCGKEHIQSMHLNIICPCGAKYYFNTHEWLSRKPQTNADRIRAMSDEELAKMIDALNAYFGMCNRGEIELPCTDCELHDLCCLGEGDALGWLRQPVKDGEGDVG